MVQQDGRVVVGERAEFGNEQIWLSRDYFLDRAGRNRLTEGDIALFDTQRSWISDVVERLKRRWAAEDVACHLAHRVGIMLGNGDPVLA